MKRWVFELGVLGLLLTISVVLPWQISHHAQLQMRAKNEEFQRQTAALKKLAAENARLTNLVAQAASAAPTEAQVLELLRLRGEIGTLRKAASETENLRARNEQARARLAATTAPLSPPDPQKVLAYWPKAQLAMSGYADPVSAVETTLWAMTRGDADTLVANATTDAKYNMTRGIENNRDLAAQAIEKATKQIADSLNPDTGFYVIEQKLTTDQNAAFVQVYFDGEGRTRQFTMQRIAGEWKFDTLGGAWP